MHKEVGGCIGEGKGTEMRREECIRKGTTDWDRGKGALGRGREHWCWGGCIGV